MNTVVMDMPKNATEAKIYKFKEKIKEGYYKTKVFYHDHKAIIDPALSAFLVAGVSYTFKQVKLNKEKRVKDYYCYDNRLGHYWKLRREPSSKEWLEIDRRKSNGERLSDILDSLKLLK